MSLIAGYQARNGRIQREELSTKLASYRILSDDDAAAYNNQIIETPFGCLLWKYRPEYPIQHKPCNDGHGNAFILLGFLNAASPMPSAEQLENSEGEFVAIRSDASGDVHIINDRFSSRPFYILNHPDGVYFSSNYFFLLHMIGNRAEADIVGWFQVFSCGHTFGNRTTIQNIRRMPPGSHLTISADGAINERRYWRLAYTPDNGLDLHSHSAAVFEAFRSGADWRSRLTGKGVIALSGGLDSRLVAGALPARAHFPAFTFIDSGESRSTTETQVATEVSKLLGLEHHIEAIPKYEFSAVANDVIRLTGGMRPLHNSATVMPYIRELKRRGLNFLLGGGPGDVSAGSKIPSARYLVPAQMDRCIHEFAAGIAVGSESFATFFRPEIVQAHRRTFDQSLLETIAELTGPTAAHRITAWELLHRWPAFTFTSVLHNHPEASEGFCHLDYRYADLMLQLPAEWLYQRNFYSCMIYDNLPELRQVPYANTGQRLSGELRHFEQESAASRIRAFGTGIARKVLPKPIKRRLRTKDSPDLFYFLYKNDERLLAELRECLHSQTKLREILDAERCLKFVDGFIADNLVDVSYSQQMEFMGCLTSICLTFKTLSQ